MSFDPAAIPQKLLRDLLKTDAAEPVIPPPFAPAMLNRKLSETAAHSPYTWEVAVLDKIGGYERLIFHKPAPRPEAPALLISAGIHGNEPAGPVACVNLLKSPTLADLEVVMIPMVNPVGFARGTRGNGDGIDLNRDFHFITCEETRNLTELYRSMGKMSAVFNAHEDWEQYRDAAGTPFPGAYLYELNRDAGPACTSALKEAIRATGMPWNPLPVIDGEEAIDGVIYRHELSSEVPGGDRVKTGLPMKMAETLTVRALGLTDLAYIVETPSYLELERRVRSQVAAAEALARALPRIRPVRPYEARRFRAEPAAPGRLSRMGLERELAGGPNAFLFNTPPDPENSPIRPLFHGTAWGIEIQRQYAAYVSLQESLSSFDFATLAGTT